MKDRNPLCIHFISKPVLGGAEMIAFHIAKASDGKVLSIFKLKQSKLHNYNLLGQLYFFKNIFHIKKVFSHTPATYIFNSIFSLFFNYENIFVLHCRLDLINKYLWLIKLFSKDKKIICVSSSVFEEASKIFKDSKLFVINNIPLNNKVFDFKSKSDQPTRFFYIGRISSEKGIYEFVNYLKNHNKDEILEIYGEGNKNFLNKMLNINYRYLNINGWKKNPYQDIGLKDVIIIPSNSESFSLVLHEAVNFGIRTYVFDKTLLNNLSGHQLEYVFLMEAFDDIYEHIKVNPPNNLLNNIKTNASNDIKLWAEKYNKL